MKMPELGSYLPGTKDRDMSCVMRKPVLQVSDQLRSKPGCIQPQKIARGFNYELEGLYYLCS